MNFIEARNKITYKLEQHIGCPVILSEQIADQPEYPYCYYSVLSSRISKHAFGLRELIVDENIALAQRFEPVEATIVTGLYVIIVGNIVMRISFITPITETAMKCKSVKIVLKRITYTVVYVKAIMTAAI